MGNHIIKLKQDNMLCHRCLLNVAAGLSRIESIEEFNIDLDAKRVRVIYDDKDISREEIRRVINESILKGVKRKS